MKRYKKQILTFLFSVFLFGSHVYGKSAVTPILLYINQVERQGVSVSSTIVENNLMVAVRDVLEPLGAFVEYRPEVKEVSIVYQNHLMTMTVGQKNATVDGKAMNLLVAPQIIDNKLMVPARFVGENFGFQVEYDAKTKALKLNEIAVVENIDTMRQPVQTITEPEGQVQPPQQTVVEPVAPPVQNIDVTLRQDGQFDYVDIQGVGQGLPRITEMVQPHRLVLDFPGVAGNVQSPEVKDGIFVQAIRGGQYEGDVLRVVLDLKSQVTYDLSGTTGDRFSIKIGAPTFQNISYNTENRTLVLKKDPNTTLDVNAITTIDQYTNKKFEILFNTDLSSFFGYGKMRIEDEVLQDVQIVTEEGQTKLVINENLVRCFDIQEDGEQILIKVLSPKELYPMVVVLDAGHGGHDSGAVGNGVREKDLNLDIAQRVYDLVERDHIVKAYMTRNDDVFIGLLERPRIGNELGDIFISFHNNSTGKSSISGTEVFYMAHSNDEALGFASKTMAQIMQRNLLEALGTVNRNVQTKDLAVNRESNIPSVLLEVGFVSNPEEASRLADPNFRQQAAEAIYKGILEVYQQYQPQRP